jgi:hypothetical protein
MAAPLPTGDDDAVFEKGTRRHAMSESAKRFWDANDALVRNEMTPAGRAVLVAVMWAITMVAMALLWICSR